MSVLRPRVETPRYDEEGQEEDEPQEAHAPRRQNGGNSEMVASTTASRLAALTGAAAQRPQPDVNQFTNPINWEQNEPSRETEQPSTGNMSHRTWRYLYGPSGPRLNFEQFKKRFRPTLEAARNEDDASFANRVRADPGNANHWMNWRYPPKKYVFDAANAGLNGPPIPDVPNVHGGQISEIHNASEILRPNINRPGAAAQPEAMNGNYMPGLVPNINVQNAGNPNTNGPLIPSRAMNGPHIPNNRVWLGNTQVNRNNVAPITPQYGIHLPFVPNHAFVNLQQGQNMQGTALQPGVMNGHHMPGLAHLHNPFNVPAPIPANLNSRGGNILNKAIRGLENGQGAVAPMRRMRTNHRRANPINAGNNIRDNQNRDRSRVPAAANPNYPFPRVVNQAAARPPPIVVQLDDDDSDIEIIEPENRNV